MAVVHDKALARSLLTSFLVLIVSGLAMNQLITLFVEHHLPLEHATEDSASSWKHLEWKDGSKLSAVPSQERSCTLTGLSLPLTSPFRW